MIKNIDLVNIGLLKMHERTNPKRLSKLFKAIKKLGYLKNPIIVDKKTKVVLDGHHRLVALKSMQINKIPVFFVDYMNFQIRVLPRRQKIFQRILKKEIINHALANQLFPYKTTKHFLKFRPRNINIKLANLFY